MLTSHGCDIAMQASCATATARPAADAPAAPPLLSSPEDADPQLPPQDVATSQALRGPSAAAMPAEACPQLRTRAGSLFQNGSLCVSAIAAALQLGAAAAEPPCHGPCMSSSCSLPPVTAAAQPSADTGSLFQNGRLCDNAIAAALQPTWQDLMHLAEAQGKPITMRLAKKRAYDRRSNAKPTVAKVTYACLCAQCWARAYVSGLAINLL